MDNEIDESNHPTTKSYTYVKAMHGEFNPSLGSGQNLIFLPPKETTEESTSLRIGQCSGSAVIRIRIGNSIPTRIRVLKGMNW
jgi:hypothetical protein